MDLTERTKIMAEGDFQVFNDIAREIIAAGDIRVIRESRPGLVMMQARDSVDGQPFNLGDVLMAEAVVELHGCRGYGFALGDEPDQAMCRAVLEAALLCGHPLAAKIMAALKKEAAAIEEGKVREMAAIARTRVDFEVMEG